MLSHPSTKHQGLCMATVLCVSMVSQPLPEQSCSGSEGCNESSIITYHQPVAQARGIKTSSHALVNTRDCWLLYVCGYALSPQSQWLVWEF